MLKRYDKLKFIISQLISLNFNFSAKVEIVLNDEN